MSKITRRSFIQKAGLFTAGCAAISADLPGYKSNTANAQVLPEWLNLTQETALEPDLPIIDPHHHFWDRPNNRYMLEDLLEDTAAHNVRQTVFVECTSMYRAAGPEELKVIGETEFVQGIAAKSASGGYGDKRIATGIVGSADLRLGDKVAPVLEAHIAASPQRFRGIRHRAAWADRSVLPNLPADAPRNIL